MCQMCEEEASYQAYMLYLEEMEKPGADHDKAMDAVIAQIEKMRAQNLAEMNGPDVAVSRFSCEPIEKQ